MNQEMIIETNRAFELKAVAAKLVAAVDAHASNVMDILSPVTDVNERIAVRRESVKLWRTVVNADGTIGERVQKGKNKGKLASVETLEQRFDRAARLAGWASRKAKANAKGKGKGKGKPGDGDVGGEPGKALTVSGKDAVARLLAVSTFIGEWKSVESDPIVLDRIAKLLAIVQGATAKAGKRDKSAKAGGAVRVRKAKATAATVAAA